MPKSPRRTRPSRKPVSTPHQTDPEISARLLAFLYGDVGLNQHRMAKLLGTSIAAVERAVKKAKLKPLRPVLGEYNRAALARFLEICGPKVKDTLPKNVRPEYLWVEIRKLLRRAVPSFFANEILPARVLERFLEDLPHILKAAEARLAKPRLELLHGEFQLDKHDIAELLDVPPAVVAKALAEARVHRGEFYLSLTGDGYCRLAQALGRAEFPLEDRMHEGFERFLRRQMVSARDGFRAMVRAGQVDWSAVDRFIATETVHAEKKERLFKKT